MKILPLKKSSIGKAFADKDKKIKKSAKKY